MIRTLLVDDERLSLHRLQDLLTELPEVVIIGACTKPAEAMEMARDHKPDVVFMDIHMPEMNGLRAAELIQQVCPGVQVVFVTAYDAYALEAFELHAMDYLLKPVDPNRLMKTVQRLKKRLAKLPGEGKGNAAVRLHTLPKLGYSVGNFAPLAFKWRTSKAQDLFAYLLHHRSRMVGRDALLEVLWPDFDPKKAATHLYTTIYQTRQSLKHAGLDISIENMSGGDGYTLDLKQVSVDGLEWEKDIRAAGEITSKNLREHQRLFDLYKGDYLGDYDYAWAEEEQERLRTIWLHHASQLANAYTQAGKITEAITAYRRLTALHPYYEEGYLRLMMLYEQTGEMATVEECFMELHQRVAVELGVKLSPGVYQWYHSRAVRS
jgi:two-component system, LytTR family, response regulator